MHTYKYPRPIATADMIIQNVNGEILLIKRKNPPFQGQWALPGGFLDVGQETMEDCAIREAKEETGLEVQIERLVGLYTHPKRDPRAHSITGAYLSRPISMEQAKTAKAADDASEEMWLDPRGEWFQNIDFAFDHKKMICDAFGLPCEFQYPEI